MSERIYNKTGADAAIAAAVSTETSNRTSAEGTEATARATADTTETARAETAEGLRAPLASPALTGTPTAPTQPITDISTRLATTLFVNQSLPMLDVKKYGAVGDGSSDDTAALTAAITAAYNSTSGGYAYKIPTGLYIVSAPLPLYAGTLAEGCGMGATIIRAKSGSSLTSLFATPTGQLNFEVTLSDMQLDGNSGGGATVTHAFYGYGLSDSVLSRLRVVNCSGDGIMLDGSGTYLGTAVKIVNSFVRSCHIGVNNQASATDTMIQGCDVGQNTNHAYYIGASNCSLVGSIGWGSSTVGLYVDSSVTAHWVSGCRFDNNGINGIYSKGNDVVIDGTFVHDNSHNSPGAAAGILIDTGAGRHNLRAVRSTGNLIPGQSQQSYGLQMGASRTALTYVDGCDFTGNGTAGLGGDSSNLKVARTLGVNPVGYLGSPSVPSSGSTFTNPYPYDSTVYLHGGSISGISLNGQGITTYFGIPPVTVPQGSTVTLTYTGSPQWDWYNHY